jgi:hypothetical protein
MHRSYWPIAVKAAWNAFVVQHRLWSIGSGVLGVLIGAAIAKAHPNFAPIWVISSSGGVPGLLFLFQLLIRIPSKLWRESDERLTPKFRLEYDSSDSLPQESGHTVRLRVTTDGPTTIDDVRMRLMRVEPSDLSGILPLRVRNKDVQESTLYGDAPMLFDLIEYPHGGGYTDDEEFAEPVSISICHTIRQLGPVELPLRGEYEFDIEVAGRNVATVRRTFRVTCGAPESTHSGSLHGTVKITPAS